MSRKLLFMAILVVTMYLLVEAMAFGLFLAVHRKPLSIAEYESMRESVATGRTARSPAQATGPVIMHPYLGFVSDPEMVDFTSDYGFYEHTVPIATQDPESVVVGIFGGSFASQLSTNSKETFINALKRHPPFSNKNIVVLNIALGGYKQPQQLFALIYFLAMGGRFDLVLNIDGYNEVALPVVENLPKGVSPFFPRIWYVRLSGMSDTAMLKFAGEISLLQERQKNTARLFSRRPIRYSYCANLLWMYYNRKLAEQENQKEIALSDYKVRRKQNLELTGPRFNYEMSRPKLLHSLASAWTTASLQMRNVCDANGITYFHFLQPNQYVPGSKPMKDAERKIAFDENNRYRQATEAGYRHLVRAGAELQKAGVRYTDLTMTFVGNEDILYADDCCHLNKQGYDLIAERIGQIIRETLPQQKP